MRNVKYSKRSKKKKKTGEYLIFFYIHLSQVYHLEIFYYKNMELRESAM
jgi:hypothetical protein